MAVPSSIKLDHTGSFRHFEFERYKQKGNTVYNIYVEFDGSKKVDFTIQAQTLQVALEMIEAFARESKIQAMSPANFEKFKNDEGGKLFYGAIEHGDDGSTAITFYKHNRLKTGLKALSNDVKHKQIIEKKMVNEIDFLAKGKQHERVQKKKKKMESSSSADGTYKLMLNRRNRESDV